MQQPVVDVCLVQDPWSWSQVRKLRNTVKDVGIAQLTVAVHDGMLQDHAELQVRVWVSHAIRAKVNCCGQAMMATVMHCVLQDIDMCFS